MRRTLLSPQRREGAKNRGYPAPGIPAIQTVTLQRQRRPVSPRRHGAHGDFTEASGFSVHLRVLRVSVVNKVPEFFLSLASRRSSGLALAESCGFVFMKSCTWRALRAPTPRQPKGWTPNLLE